MLTKQSCNTVGNSLTKYALISGVIFFALIFIFHIYFVMLSSYYVGAFILMFISTTGKRRVTKLKIQASRLDIYFSYFWNSEIKSFQLADLQGRYSNAKAILGKPYSVLEITQDKAVVCAVETRVGFEEGRLKTLLSLLN